MTSPPRPAQRLRSTPLSPARFDSQHSAPVQAMALPLSERPDLPQSVRVLRLYPPPVIHARPARTLHSIRTQSVRATSPRSVPAAPPQLHSISPKSVRATHQRTQRGTPPRCPCAPLPRTVPPTPHLSARSRLILPGSIATPCCSPTAPRHRLPALSASDHHDPTTFLERVRITQQRSLEARQRSIQQRRAVGRRIQHRQLHWWGVSVPQSSPASRSHRGSQRYQIDQGKQAAYSELLRRSGIGLPALIRLIRGESASDPNPNKALQVPSDLPGWQDYQHAARWDAIVQHGVIPSWRAAPPVQVTPPPNHGSSRRALNALVKSIRKGQDDDRYLVLDIDLLKDLEGVYCSPFGAVPKGDKPLSEDARVIHDLSFPENDSINDLTLPETEVDVRYDGARAIASRIEEVERKFPGLTRMMSGDVSGAFRHIPIHADHCGRFAGTIPELGVLVIDLCCPFGWRNSPAAYAIAGGAINHIYSSSRPVWAFQPPTAADAFDGKVWCDDHNCVEPAIGSRLAEAASALRASMVHVLGPAACNEDKFTPWFVRGSALGLDWDLQRRTVSMPPGKIEKARRRICELVVQRRASRSQLNCLLGSLRHVATCLRPAAPFFQRVADAQRRTPQLGSYPINEAALDDLRWFRAILSVSRLNAIPLARFTNSQPPTVDVLMDASDAGLCAIYPARREFLQVQFDSEERSVMRDGAKDHMSGFGINLRELMSAVYATLMWGHVWSKGPGQSVHVRMRIDNTSAVAWNNKRSSRNPFAQMLLRLLALEEARYNFYVSAAHIPGVENVMADAGSRVWGSQEKARTFTNLCVGWTQVIVPPSSRKLSQVWERCSVQGL